jgi:ABC-2 type transport system permease protein
MRKVFVIALREYNAAVRTKAFIISLLIMPLLMGGSILVQALLRDQPSKEEKRFAIIDRSPGQGLFQRIEEKVAKSGEEFGHEHWVLENPRPADESDAAVDQLRVELSERVRKGSLRGFAEIGPDVFLLPSTDPKAKLSPKTSIQYRTNRPTERAFGMLVEQEVSERSREERARSLQIPSDKVNTIIQGLVPEVPLQMTGLCKVNPATGAVENTPPESQLVSFFAPLILLMLMFMVVLMTASPLMQGVVEEKMQRIAEVLLGSVRPFELMLGKLLGMTAVSLTISAVYLAGAWWAAHRYGYSDLLAPSLMAWFLVFQALAALMYGSLFAAVGAACTDMKETQTLMWPVMLLIIWPTFLVGSIMQEPNGQVITALSLIPFSTPMLLIARMGVPPGVPTWQPIVGVLGVLLTTLVCVWAAGRIFRVGILMQGKGARFGEIVHWVIHG